MADLGENDKKEESGEISELIEDLGEIAEAVADLDETDKEEEFPFDCMEAFYADRSDMPEVLPITSDADGWNPGGDTDDDLWDILDNALDDMAGEARGLAMNLQLMALPDLEPVSEVALPGAIDSPETTPYKTTPSPPPPSPVSTRSPSSSYKRPPTPYPGRGQSPPTPPPAGTPPSSPTPDDISD